MAVSSSENFRLLGVLFTSRVSLSGGVGVSPLALLLSWLFLPVPLSSWFSGLCLLIPLSSGSWLSLLLSYSFGSVLGSSFSFLSLLGCPDCAHSFSTCVVSSVSLPNPGCPLLLSYSVGLSWAIPSLSFLFSVVQTVLTLSRHVFSHPSLFPILAVPSCSPTLWALSSALPSLSFLFSVVQTVLTLC